MELKWIHTDRDNLKTKQSTVEEFIQEIVTKSANVLPRHFIAKHQINYRKETKKNLVGLFGKLAVLMDFAENYLLCMIQCKASTGKIIRPHYNPLLSITSLRLKRLSPLATVSLWIAYYIIQLQFTFSAPS